MKLFDITLPLNCSLAVWPGDTPYAFTLNWRRSEGASVNVGAITMSVHTGTHTDSPFHISDAGATIAEMSLNPYVGQALVVDVQGKKVVRIADLEPMDLLPRLLLKTNSWRDYTRFPEQVPVLAEDVPGYLKERGVVLLGVDVPSVDTIESKDLPIHHQLTRHGITILESLYLREVPAGEYELIALPMKLDGADGAPVRAILRA